MAVPGLPLEDPYAAEPIEFTMGSRGWEPLSGPQFVLGADGLLLPLQSFLFQGVSGTFLVLSWHLPQDISGRQSRGGPGRSLWHFYFQPVCPEGRSGQGAHLGLNHLGFSFLIHQTSELAQVPSEASPCSILTGPPGMND